MKRITVDEVRAAYEKTGLKPIRKVFAKGIKQKCGCALTACAVASGAATFSDIVGQDFKSEYVFEALNLDIDYGDGFTEGFDGGQSFAFEGETERVLGYEDGKAAALAVFGRGK